MKCALIVHESYQQPGGEDVVATAEARLLEAHGHKIVWYRRHNDELKTVGAIGSLRVGIDTIWAARSVREVRTLIAKEKPDVAHFHNTFPLISPAVYNACVESGVPVVQTLHNYRLLCPGATFLRDGKVCEACLGRAVAWSGVTHGCYRESYASTTAVAAMLATHRLIGTWREKVDVFVALSEFARNKFIVGGLPADRIMVKPNFIEPDPGPKQGPGEYALVIGRLSKEKGLRVLLAACRELRERIPLVIAGEGPLKNEIETYVSENNCSNVRLMDRLTPEDVVRAMQRARFLVFPSIWFEGFPVSIAEAFACGLPVIASRLGSMAEIVTDGLTGLHFSAGDPEDLSRKIAWAWEHPTEMQIMGRHARAEYEAKYNANTNYEQFLRIWDQLGIPHLR